MVLLFFFNASIHLVNDNNYCFIQRVQSSPESVEKFSKTKTSRGNRFFLINTKLLAEFNDDIIGASKTAVVRIASF